MAAVPQGGEEEGVADSNEGSVASDSDSDSDHHHQDYSDEEMDSDGEDEEERDGSHDGEEFSAKSTCYYNRGYNGSNDIHDKPIVVNGSLDHGHDQHEGCFFHYNTCHEHVYIKTQSPNIIDRK